MTTSKITSRTALFLAEAIEHSSKTQREIARDAGFNRPNVLSMMKAGDTKVPIERIPALAKACGADARRFLWIALEEYHPEIWEVILGSRGGLLTTTEMDLVTLFRICDDACDVEITEEVAARLMDVFTNLVDQARAADAQDASGEADHRA